MDLNTDDPNDDPTQSEQDAYDFGLYLNELSDRFLQLCQERRSTEPFAFLEADVFQETLIALADTVNGAMQQAVKLMILQEELSKDERLAKLATSTHDAGGTVDLSFKPSREENWDGTRN